MAWGRGETSALDRLVPLVHDELRRLARRYMRRERPDHTLQATALVNEAYLRMIAVSEVRWQNRAHFFAIAARVMRQILVDSARRHRAPQRGGTTSHVSLDEALVPSPVRHPDLVALDEALTRLELVHPRKSQVVELRYFGGMKLEEAATVLGVSRDTVKRDWRFAKLWLLRELDAGTGRARACRRTEGG
jgi:RNA polymerase sigma factor (TIGR02999 family)